MKLSFRNRIAFFNTIAVAITLALVFWVIYIVVAYSSNSHLEYDLLKEKNEVLQNIHFTNDSINVKLSQEWKEAEHNKVEVNPTFIQIMDENKVIIFQTNNLFNVHLPTNAQYNDQVLYSATLQNQVLRLGQFPITNKKGDFKGLIIIGVSQQEALFVLKNLYITLLLIYPVYITKIEMFHCSKTNCTILLKPGNT